MHAVLPQVAQMTDQKKLIMNGDRNMTKLKNDIGYLYFMGFYWDVAIYKS